MRRRGAAAGRAGSGHDDHVPAPPALAHLVSPTAGAAAIIGAAHSGSQSRQDTTHSAISAGLGAGLAARPLGGRARADRRRSPGARIPGHLRPTPRSRRSFMGSRHHSITVRLRRGAPYWALEFRRVATSGATSCAWEHPGSGRGVWCRGTRRRHVRCLGREHADFDRGRPTRSRSTMAV